MTQMKAADYAWLVLAAVTVVFEVTSDDLLSEATERYCKKHPILTRAVIGAIFGHLACVMPSCVDVFSAKNMLHRGIVHMCGGRI